MASLDKVNNVFYARFRMNGKQFKKRLGQVSRTTARQMMVKLEEELAYSRMGLKMPHKIFVDQIIDIYLSWVKTNQARKTYNQKVSALNKFKVFITKHTQYAYIQYLHQITADVIEGYKCYRLDEGVANRTINIELNCISNCFRLSEEWEYLVPQFKIKRLPEQRKIPRYLSKNEIQLLYANASNHLRQVISLFLFTGMRANELLNLRWEHVDFESGYIKVANTATFTTKTKGERIIPMNAGLNKTLIYLYNNYIDQNSDTIFPRNECQRVYVLCNRDGSRIKCIRRAFSRLIDDLGLNDVCIHTLRHTFATQCFLSGIDILTIKEFLGHSRVTTTEIYTHVNQEFKTNAIEKLNGVIPLPCFI